MKVSWIPLFHDRAVILRSLGTMSRIREFAPPRWFSWTAVVADPITGI
jgi:hypothetical protein